MNVSINNGTNQPSFRLFQESSTLKSIRIFSFACIFVIGFLGNLLTMIAARRRRLQNVTNMFIANLGLADFTVSVVNIPLNIGQASLGYWPYGFTMCKVAPYLQGTTVCASIGMLVAIATERFLVIVRPIKYKLTSRHAHAIVGVIWIFSFIVPVPVLVFSQLVTANVEGKAYSGCVEIWPVRSLQTAYQMFLFLALFLWPMLTISVMYVLMEKALRSAEWLKRGNYRCSNQQKILQYNIFLSRVRVSQGFGGTREQRENIVGNKGT